MMPVEGAWPIKDVVNLIKQYDFTGQRRVSFEYTMFAGFNDTKAHADALYRMLKGLECRMNLIRFHSIPDVPLEGSSDDEIEKFQSELSKRGVLATIRKSRGEDIFAACGLLSTMKKNNEL
jgi:23S rRNA (adenine2503-C2)-methyltransferase